MRCIFCGEEISDSTPVCPWCGRRQKVVFEKNTSLNPSSNKTSHKGGGLYFKCPTCIYEVQVALQKIDPIIGVNVVCPGCKNIAHVPGGYRAESNPSGLKITGGVQVPISKFSDWYIKHPLVSSLIKNGQSDLLHEYGLWGFCANCYYQFPSTILRMLPLTQGTAGFVFSAQTPSSAKDMESLRVGHCSSCSNDCLIVIVADIPDYVLNAITSHRK